MSSSDEGLSEDRFKKLMDAITGAKKEMEDKFSASMEELRRNVTASQEIASEEVVTKLKQRTYQFRKKGNEAQFQFNSSVEDHVQSAKRELAKLTPTDASDQASVRRATLHLDQGLQAIACRQKHIKLADRSELGWQVVAAYESDDLASDSDDEKRLFKAEKEAERRSKRKRAATAGAKKRAYFAKGGPVTPRPSTRSEGTSSAVGTVRAPSVRSRPLGPCFGCGQFGHLVDSCSVRAPKTYPCPYTMVGKDGCESILCDASVLSCEALHCNVEELDRDGWDALCEASALTCKTLGSDVGQLSTKGAKCVNEMSCSEVIEQKGDKVLKPIVEGNCTEVALMGDGQPMYDYPTSIKEKYWEIQGISAQMQLTQVQGRLRTCVRFWQDVLHAPPTVIDWIQNGYKLPLLYMPTPFCQCNHRSAIQNREFVTEALRELMKGRCVRKLSIKPCICSPLSVVSSSSGKLRLVVNLRHLNQFLKKEKFKYEDLRVAVLMFEEGDFLFKFDLKSGYHHLDIFEEHQQYLGFAWEFEGKIQYFAFTVLPFGLATACYAFTKLMRPMVKHWRSRGLRAIVYIDDGVVAVKGKDNASIESEHVQKDLLNAGWVVNIEKSQWVPVKCITWLGFELDMDRGQLRVPERKLTALCGRLNEARKSQYIPAKLLASILGELASMAVALGPVSSMMTRNLYATLNARLAWCQQLSISVEAHIELDFWSSCIGQFNGQDMWPKPSAVRVVYSDASDTGYGGYTGGYSVEHGGCVATGQWSKWEAQQSSTWRELRAVRLILESFYGQLENERIRWFTDNQNVVRIVLHGSKKPLLQQEALAIFATCMKGKIKLEPEWIPREENLWADYLSRMIDYDDWMLNPLVFNQLNARWGPFTVDRFAEARNAQLPRFNSRHWSPGTEAVDTFTCDWGNENNWWCPPIYLIPRLLKHARVTKAMGALVVPEWRSAPFWPLLYPDGVQPAGFVKDVCELPRKQSLFVAGPSGSVLFKGVPNTPVLALLLHFS